jgi:hypothetical protein
MTLKKTTQFISVIILLVTVYYSFYSLTPSFKSESEAITEFSTKNALQNLEIISQKPHYTGSAEHIVVRDFLINEFEKLGLQVEIQEQVAINTKWRGATNAKNIITRIKGTENGKALLLLCHYDSSPHSSLGASDAGSGVVVILEGIRTFLAQNKTHKNDIIICITDAEELGLLGANAFVNHHPWAKNIGLVLNFEARGSGGPSYMLLETNGGNRKLIEAFQKANTPFPVANSLVYSIYKMLPNDTDLTVFREDGDIDGFNFAFIDDHFDYHTAQDSFERMDLNTFQHQVSYLMASLDYFSNENLSNLKANEDDVFFNFPYFGLIFYPFSWVTSMFIICVVLFFILIFIGFVKRKLTVKGVLKGFVPLLLSLLLSSLLAVYGWKLLLKIHPQYNDILHGFTYNGYLYMAAFVLFTIAISFWFYVGFFKKRTLQDLLIAPLFLWLIINGGIAFYLKGAAFFILPVIILLFVLSRIIFSKKPLKPTLLYTILAIPILIIFAPLIKMFPVGLGLKMMVISTIFTVLLFGFLVPVFHQYNKPKKFAYLFLVIGITFLISAETQAGFNLERKQPNSILYLFDTNKNEAYWVSYNATTDTFTEQFFGENPSTENLDKIRLSSKYKTPFNLNKKTNIVPLKNPEIDILLDTIIGGNRMVNLTIESLRNANRIELLSNIPIQFKLFKVNGEAIKSNANNKYVFSVENGTIMSYFLTSEDEILNLEFTVDKNQKFDIDILEAKWDLFTNPLFNIKPRANDMMPTPFVLNDATVIKTNLTF